MNTLQHPQNDTHTMGQELKKLEGVLSVSYEFPGFWEIATTRGTYSLGDVDGFFSWHTSDTETTNNQEAGESAHYTISGVVADFANFLRGN